MTTKHGAMVDRIKLFLTDPRLPVWLFATACAVGFALLLYLHRQIGYFADDWNFVIGRDGSRVDQFLGQHNGHFVAIPLVVFKLISATFGTGTMWPFHLLSTGLQVLVAVLIFAWIRRLVDAWVAFMVATVVLMLGSGWEIVFWSFQIGFLGSMAAGIGSLMVFEREDSTRNRVTCAALLSVSLASSGLGAVFLIAVATRLLWREERRKTLVVIAAPGVLFSVWYFVFGLDYNPGSKLVAAPAFALELLTNAFAGTMGLDGAWGRVIAAFAIFGLFRVLVRDNGIRPKLLMVLALPLAFWFLTAKQRAGFSVAYPPRYVYVGVVFIFLAGAEALRGEKLNRGAHIGIAGLFAVALAMNTLALKDGAGMLRSYVTTTRAELSALALALPNLPSSAAYEPFDPTLTEANVPQLAALVAEHPERFAWSIDEIASQDDASRSKVDGVLVQLLPPAVTPARRPAVTELINLEHVGGTVTATSAGRCKRLPAGPEASIDASVPKSGLYVESDGAVKLRLRRFGSGFSMDPQQTIPSGGHNVSVSGDAQPPPWVAQLTSTANVLVCAKR